jgi:hypothetical protein
MAHTQQPTFPAKAKSNRQNVAGLSVRGTATLTIIVSLEDCCLQTELVFE